MEGASGRLLQVNVGTVQTFMIGGRLTDTAIVKTAVDGPTRIDGVLVDGDAQANTTHHGGRDQAVYAYARESYDWWERQRDQHLPNGFFGENLTLHGVDVDGARIGEHWRIGEDVELEVRAPRIPCAKLDWRMQDAFTSTFLQADRPGAYLRVVTPGSVRSGDPVDVVSRPDHDVTVADVMRLVRGDDVAAHVLTAGKDLQAAVRDRARGRAG